ncbi:thioredoxin family protein [Bacillus shivajii]|uniref:thioredoxin family protein n=1 Tax=Bacillus shivajii TaxID=1983719 RepID=UPI001CFB694E|nr:thioredoxin family protein [Bacillus shivajii]UCZ52064.1 thioredoxin family protein [Bacillus shivajii]
MNIKLYITRNIIGKVVEKRLLEVLNDIGIHVNLDVYYEDASPTQGIIFTPTLLVNGQVMSTGKVLSKDELTQIFM